ncbi:DUF4238 domain-containing protein [Spiroplasma endosymbiont of Cantharis nigra]|uniref:DUF4238 domain-containing protein n=1 Tax=Spiroplasma endosymbiont of Cantharis nigra TaxID=3066278 RepID=UPI0030D2E542
MKIKYRQHFIPRFILKKWSDKDFYTTYDLENNIYKQYNIRNYNNDPFHIKNFYESRKMKINEIENKLTKIEVEYQNILKLIENKQIISLNRYQTKFLRLYTLIDIYRSNAALERALNLEGGIQYNNYYKNKTFEQIKEEYLSELNYLVTNIYNYSKNNISMFNEEMILRIENKINKIQKYIEEKNDFDEIFKQPYNEDLKDRIATNILDIYKANTKFISIPDAINERFLLTDAMLVEYFGDNNSKKFRLPILMIKIINPKLALAYMPLDLFDHVKVTNHVYNSFWIKVFPNLFLKNNKVEYEYGKKINDDIQIHIKKNPNASFLEIYDTFYSNNDKYEFEVYKLENSNQVNLINAMNLSQTSRYLIFENKEDFKKARKTMKENNIYRIENLGL